MTCAYFSISKSLAAIPTGQMNFFDGSQEVLYVPERTAKQCDHKRTVQLRKIGGVLIALCKCHFTRLKKRHRQKRISQRIIRVKNERRQFREHDNGEGHIQHKRDRIFV